ncbi:MAG: 5'/3'-nucleotidase SurE [Phycisphaerae bacterium]|nr:5'/3'-nucleotidase SurE [Phycisphaerae bacterium]
MLIVLTNDDGYEAPGLHAAYEAARRLGEVRVVAPRSERSACSHTITLRRPIAVERLRHDHYGEMYAVDGTPADCVRLAFAELIGEEIDLVLSGVNRGANAGVDVYYSGTVAGAREAAILRIPAIAVSQAVREDVDIDWHRAREVTKELLPGLLEEQLPAAGFWNINMPSPIPETWQERVRRVPVAGHAMPMKFNRREHKEGSLLEFTYGASYWLREERGPSDYTTIRDGEIAVSAVPLMGRFGCPGDGPVE